MTFSKLILGTVQFGMDYGIANTSGKPSFVRVCEILKCAAERGVTSLDTAATYGTSEEVLGKALEKLGLRDSMTVVSKVPPINAQSDAGAEKFIEDSLRESLRRLKLERLAVCLLHREEDLRFFPQLEKMVDKGLIGGAGISLDSDRFLLDVTLIPYIQFPCNVLDKRFDKFWPEAERNGTRVFARSVYLQGLLLMPEDKMINGLSEVIPIRRNLQKIATAAGCTITELCIRYVLSNPAVTSVLTGVDTVEQLQENLRLAALGALPQELVLQIDECVPKLPESVIRPALWSK